ncbi:heterodisulfide reductase-related iron-sulfur binding cluster [Actinopolymorpha pittospori]|uniref:Cysteine-rich domain-containing protein n=1 Tax=Actinopolymorpha pittospori TaxID=648752 RepID=A0A927R9B7_9ACTN|nr:hypothetical protein [Actinopolymorpha pittospori]
MNAVPALGVETSRAGTGVQQEYGDLLRDDPQWAQWAQWAARRYATSANSPNFPRARRGTPSTPASLITTPVTWPTQGIRRQRREVLATVSGLAVHAIAEAELCCGSAGVFNLVQAETAEELGRRKVANVAATSRMSSLPPTRAACCRSAATSTRACPHPPGAASRRLDPWCAGGLQGRLRMRPRTLTVTCSLLFTGLPLL